MSYIQQSNPIVHSLTRSGVQGVRIDASASSRSKILHTQENRVNSTCLCQCNKITCHQFIMPHNHNQMPKSIIIWITCEQVSSKNKFAQCAQERDVTSFDLCFKQVTSDSSKGATVTIIRAIVLLQLSKENYSCLLFC
jgi:hypothetical protein